MFLQWVTRFIKKNTNFYKKPTPSYYLGNFLIFLVIWHVTRQIKCSSRGYYMIKLIKITKQYITWAYTTDRYIRIIRISILQEGWRWHCYSHSAKLCLSAYKVTFEYSTLKAHISKTTNDRNQQISDSESRHLDGTTYLRLDSSCTNNIHGQRDAQKHCFN